MPIAPLNGIEIHYRDEGRGESLLLIHNLTSNIEGFKDNFPELSRRFRTVAADLRGHGRSAHEEDFDRAATFYTFDNLVDDQLALLDHLGIDEFYLFGQAYWGANTALHLFARIPDRVLGIVISSSCMIVSDEHQKPYDVLGESGRRNFLRMHALARESGMMAVYKDRLEFGQFWGPKVLNDPAILAEFARAHELTSAAAFVTMLRLTADTRRRIAALLAARETPLMMLLGEDEQAQTRGFFISEMRTDYPQTHILLVPQSGHYPTIENPRDFNRALLNFYAGTLPRRR